MTDNRTTELLPCPFCGGEADEYEGEYGNGIYCMMCGAKMGDPIHLEYRLMNRVSIDKAIAAWNTRVDKTCEMVTSGTDCKGNTDKRCTSCGAYGIGEHYDVDEHIATPKFCPECGAKVVKR